MGKILALTGQSGSGKTTIAKELIKNGKNVVMVTSLTTRSPRVSDISGEYQRMTPAEISELDSEGELLWAESHGGNHYGTPRQFVSDIIHGPEDKLGLMILVPSVLQRLVGFLKLLGRESSLSLVFINASETTRMERLRLRGDLSPEKIEDRIKAEKGWMKTWSQAIQFLPSEVPFNIINNEWTVSNTVSEVRKIVGV